MFEFENSTYIFILFCCGCYYTIKHFVQVVEEVIETVPYDRFYIEEFVGLPGDSVYDVSAIDVSFAHLKNIFIEELTPSGTIFMNYDNDAHGFTYYTNNAITYKFLDTVARKYMIENDCKVLNINLSLEFEKLEQKNKLLELKKESIIDSSDEDCVYVKFKSYNLKSNKVSKHTIKEKLNNFKKAGNLYDYSQRNENKESLPEKKTLNFKDYKNYKKNKEI